MEHFKAYLVSQKRAVAKARGLFTLGPCAVVGRKSKSSKPIVCIPLGPSCLRSGVKPMKSLKRQDIIHLEAAQGWLELGDPVQANLEFKQISVRSRSHPDVLE